MTRLVKSFSELRLHGQLTLPVLDLFDLDRDDVRRLRRDLALSFRATSITGTTPYVSLYPLPHHQVPPIILLSANFCVFDW